MRLLFLVLMFSTLTSLPLRAQFDNQVIEMVLLSDTDNSVYSEGTLALDTLNLIESYALPKLKIHHRVATHHRSWQLIKKIPNACLLNFIKTEERVKKVIFSKYPLTYYPPVRFITQEEHSFSSPFSFEQLNEKHFRRVGIVKGRLYTPLLDRKISSYRKFLLNSSTVNATHKQISMLEKGRIDGFIEYPREVQDYVMSKPISISVVALPILGVDEPVTGYIACAKTVQGQAIINAIDHAYLDPNMRDRFVSLHQHYFGEVESKLLTPLIQSLLTIK